MTTLKDHVVSLELAKELKAAGYPQDNCLFMWTYDPIKKLAYVHDSDTIFNFEKEEDLLTAAPLASEIGEMLPVGMSTFRVNTKWEEWIKEKSFCVTNFDEEDPLADFVHEYGSSEADARAKMWLYLKKNGLL